MGHAIRIVARLPHHAGIFLELLMQEPERFGALHGRDGIFPDADFRMVNPAFSLMRTNQIATEISNADMAVMRLRGRQIHAMERDQPARLRHAKQLAHDQPIVIHEHRIILTIAHVTVGRRIGIQAREGRRVDREINRVIWLFTNHIDAIAEMCLPAFARLTFAHVIGFEPLRGAAQGRRVQVLHMLHHGIRHLNGVMFLATDVSDHGAFGIRRDQMHLHRAHLSESPTPPNGLVKLFIGVAEAHKGHLPALLEVQAEAPDRRLRDHHANLAILKSNGRVFLVLRRI